MNYPHPTWIEVNLSAIAHNTRLVKENLSAGIMAVVKDNGYGHGAVEVARAMLANGASALAVARVQEGRELRQAGFDVPILVLGAIAPLEAAPALRNRLSLMVHNHESAAAISSAARELGQVAPVHLKIDTGMGRFGVFPEEAPALARHVQELGAMEIEGIFSHLPSAGEDPAFTTVQITRFRSAVDRLAAAGIHPRWVHLANTEAIHHHPEAFFNLVRAGGVLYAQGIREGEPTLAGQLRRTFEWKAQLLSCRAFPPGYGIGYSQTYHTSAGEIIGVVPVGYGDGYQRASGTSVLIDGKRMPVVGRVCMDQFMVRLDRAYPVGSEVVLVGRQGSEIITQEEIQRIWKSSFSTVTLAHPRVPRIYIED